MNNGLISVIIPVYNAQSYLNRCLLSIINQTYKNIEIICVDDGSNDMSGAILNKFAKKDRRIIVIHKTNSGVSSARNMGLKKATGNYIAFVDCDDWLELNMYKDMIELMNNNNVEMVSVGYFLNFTNKEIVVKNNRIISEKIINRDHFMEYVYHRDEYRAVTSWLWCKLYKRNLLYKNNELILFNKNVKFGEDIIFFAKILLNTRHVVYSEKPYYHYFQQDSSISHSTDEYTWLELVNAYVYILGLYTKNNINKIVINFVKRFLVYRAEITAKLAYHNKNSRVLSLCQKIMIKYKEVYFYTNRDYHDRLERFKIILTYNCDK